MGKRLGWAVGASFLFSFAIECSQLYSSDWINSIRNTVIGALILGRGYLTVDLVRYTFGILVAYFIDMYLISKRIGKSRDLS
jgi:glycopeptide antibiotics resistance protein